MFGSTFTTSTKTSIFFRISDNYSSTSTSKIHKFQQNSANNENNPQVFWMDCNCILDEQLPKIIQLQRKADSRQVV